MAASVVANEIITEELVAYSVSDGVHRCRLSPTYFYHVRTETSTHQAARDILQIDTDSRS